MTVVAFPDPFVHRYQRRCRKCSEWVEVICLNGADCPREGFFTCCSCHDVPAATGARVAALTVVAQPELGGDAA